MYLASITALPPPSPRCYLALGLTCRQAHSFKGNFRGVFYFFFYLFIDLNWLNLCCVPLKASSVSAQAKSLRLPPQSLASRFCFTMFPDTPHPRPPPCPCGSLPFSNTPAKNKSPHYQMKKPVQDVKDWKAIKRYCPFKSCTRVLKWPSMIKITCPLWRCPPPPPSVCPPNRVAWTVAHQ